MVSRPTALVATLAMGAGILIGYVDSRPNWDDTGMTAGALLLSAFILAAARPRIAWAAGLAVGMPVVVFQYVLHANVGAAVALLFSMAGAGAGYGLGRTLGPNGKSRRVA